MAKLKDKVKNALDEARMLVIGAQVLAGLQFRSFFEKGFDSLPLPSQLLTLVGLGLMLVAIGLLISPAAYHRIVERGEESEHFHRFASKVLVAALVPLALGLCGDVYVVVLKVTESQLVSVVAALVTLAIFWELWFGLTLYRRTQREYAS